MQLFLKQNYYEAERQKNIFLTRDVITLNVFIKRKLTLHVHDGNFTTATTMSTIYLLDAEKAYWKQRKTYIANHTLFRRNAIFVQPKLCIISEIWLTKCYLINVLF